MLSYLILKGFKSFRSIKLDLRQAHGEPRRIAFIYGENGSGKTNLMSSVVFLRSTFDTLSNTIALSKFPDEYLKKPEVFPQRLRERVVLDFLGASNLSSLIATHRMIDFQEPMSLEIGFRLDGYDGSYLMEFEGAKITKERLRYRISERQGTLFTLSDEKKSLNPSIFHNVEYRNELQDNIDKYWGKHTLLAILFNEFKQKNKKYLVENIGQSLFVVAEWLDSICYMCKKPGGETGRVETCHGIFMDLERGTVKSKDDRGLSVAERVLNIFFTQLYSDIKKVYYAFTPAKDGWSYELFFSKLIDGETLDIPMALESTGTRQLLHVFPSLFSAVARKTVLIDEIDNGIHDLLFRNLIEIVEESLEGQLIATTHNTLLLENLSPQTVFIIVVGPDGAKEILSIVDYEKRTQRMHSMRKKYLQGDYDGIPYPGYFDFRELVEDVEIALSEGIGRPGGLP